MSLFDGMPQDLRLMITPEGLDARNGLNMSGVDVLGRSR